MKKLAALILVFIAISCIYTLMDNDDDVLLKEENKRVIIIERQEEPLELDSLDGDSSYLINDKIAYYRRRELKVISQVILVAFELLMYG